MFWYPLSLSCAPDPCLIISVPLIWGHPEGECPSLSQFVSMHVLIKSVCSLVYGFTASGSCFRWGLPILQTLGGG